MITVIYDINGNPHKIQGAGAVYNEEKNSLALGNGTVATGQDQLVFGRKNVEDANKVEIVGGGVAQGSSNIERVYWYDEDHGIQGYYLLQKVASTQEEFESYVKDLYTVDSVQHNTALNTPNWNNMKGVYKYLSAHTGSDYSDVTDYSSDNYRYWLIEADNKVVGVWTGHSPSNDYAECTWLAGRLTPISIIDDSYKNIRTLDWDGNETLAGSLAIGEDSVACTKGQLVFGKGNMANAYKAEIVGNGKDNIDDITDDVVTYISTLPVGTVLTIKTNASSWLKELSLRIVTHTYSEFASKFPLKHFNTIDFELMHSADASRIIACCEVVSEIPDVWSTSDLDIRHDKAAPMLLVRSSTYKLLLVSPTELDVDGTSLTTRFSYANGERISGVTAPKNIRTLDWNGNEELAGSLKVGTGITIGETSLSEEELIALKALLNT